MHLGLSILTLWHRVRARLFSRMVSGSFARFGAGTVLDPPVRLSGTSRIAIGSRVYVGGYSWLQTQPSSSGNGTAVVLSIGNGVSMAGHCTVSAVERVCIEDNVLLARNVYISDHIHKYSQIGVPIKDQGLDKIAPVTIREGAWLGQNVVVCPGVTIGKGAVIGANSVVTTDVEDYSVAVGAPARVVKRFGAAAEE